VATVEQCEQALQALAARMAASAPAQRELDFDRTLSATISDLRVVFAGRLKNGQLLDIAQTASRDAQVRITLTGDDLVALVDGELKMAPAWATGRVRIEAGVRDLLRLRSVF
jgi:alkyl sulfatase BDS1-like metallo-beta-lactamase superfamily hydrolase